jgi:hypothetical protein
MARADPRFEELVGNAERPYVVRPDRQYSRDDLMQGWHRGADQSMTLDGRIYDYVKAHGGRAPDMEEGLTIRREGRRQAGDHGGRRRPRGPDQ